MFIENAKNPGWIEVICGSMFSGKTEELIRRLKRAKIANQRVEIFKPRIDTRYSEESVVSHQVNSILSTPVDSARSILEKADGVDVVVIDEVQEAETGEVHARLLVVLPVDDAGNPAHNASGCVQRQPVAAFAEIEGVVFLRIEGDEVSALQRRDIVRIVPVEFVRVMDEPPQVPSCRNFSDDRFHNQML